MLIKKKNRLMSIDSSINNLGMVLWEISTKQVLLYKLVHPKVGSRYNEYEKSWSMLIQLKEFIKIYAVNRIICEVSDHWSIGGFEARESGSIAKLSFVCGLIYSLREDMEEFKLVKPREWKQQIPKHVMINRLRDEYMLKGINLDEIDGNVADAVGIGHFYLFGSV